MGRKQVVAINYSLKDQFTSKHRKVVKSINNIGDAAARSARKVEQSNSRINRSLNAISSVTTKVGRAGGIVGAVVGVGGAALGKVAKDMDQIGKAAQKLGVGSAELSKLSYAAELADIQFKQLETGMQRMIRRISEVSSTGKGTAKNALEELGLSAEKLNQLSADEQLLSIADAMQRVETQSDRVRLAFSLFDSEGVNFVRMFEDGAFGIKQAGDELERLGGVISDQNAREAAQYADNMARLSRQFEGMGQTLGNKVIPVVNDLVAALGFEEAPKNLDQVNDRIYLLQARIQRLTNDLNNKNETLWEKLFVQDDGEIMTDIAAVREELDNLIEKKRQLSGVGSNVKDHKLVQAEIQATEELEKALQAQLNAYEAFNQQIQQAKQTQKEIAEEFAENTREAIFGKKEEEPKTFQNLADSYRGAKTELEGGNFDKAIEKAREASQIIKDMMEQGFDRGPYFSNMAIEIERVANSASQKKVNANEGAFDALKAESSRLQQTINEDPMQIVPEIDLAPAIQMAKTELQNQSLGINIDPIVDANKIRNVISNQFDQAVNSSGFREAVNSQISRYFQGMAQKSGTKR